ncbi:hypothetical protein DFJ58DRAFT_738591 [Suillus subalutaceus]|uniref:uncharacterized protein n=1 Tax=Suillus subalutaceus TaxID=48586 RepID=UPI001B867221|nr:uncharacterized protein DFJ58DRAFT_738591 [Suillus subalutaceus]KAG1825138.1 hypothetical protein DFJ58DRAFT_738591 [Suillus subalutaceus]
MQGKICLWHSYAPSAGSAPAPAPPLFCSPLSLQLSAPVFALPSALAPALTPTPAPVVAFATSLPSSSPSIPQNSSF